MADHSGGRRFDWCFLLVPSKRFTTRAVFGAADARNFPTSPTSQNGPGTHRRRLPDDNSLTIRNAVVFGHFIPVSLGAGQTLLEGIADYDETGSLGLSVTDVGLIKQEAETHNRPDYALTLFGPDAIQRDRERLARGFGIVRNHPIWFFTVMIRRAASMWRLERAPLISRTTAFGAGTTLAALVVGGIQRLFITATILPLVIAGLILLALKKQGSVLAILLVVPVYYFCFQSVLHTEYRYVLTLHYFLFVIAAVAIHWLGRTVQEQVLKRGNPQA